MAKRGRKPKEPKEKKYYFCDREEDAIVRYINTDDEVEKNNIFNEILHPALTIMIESIIRRYRLYVPEEIFQQTFDDTIAYVMMKINNFNPSKGTKAYSYCGTVCKNYLIQKIVQHSKDQQRYTSYDTVSDVFENSSEYSTEDEPQFGMSEKLINDTSDEIRNMIENPDKFQLNDNERKVGRALVELLDNWEDLLQWNNDDSNKLRKSEVLYFLREETMMTTKEVRDNMKKFRIVYYLMKKNLINE